MTLRTVVTNAPASFKPLLAGKAPDDLSTLRFPVLVPPKLDGIRCVIRGGVAMSRNLKPIPNAYVQERLQGLPDGLDGELIVGAPTGDVWARTQSGVMSGDGEPDFTYWVFDKCGPSSFHARLTDARLAVAEAQIQGKPLVLVPHPEAADVAELMHLENEFVGQGYEGVMIRDPHGAYKFGRSTTKEGGLLKLKRWNDAEATVTGFVERMHNGNEATKDELGRTKRSTHKANKTGRGDLGALVCSFSVRGDSSPVTFELGTGFDDAQREAFWASQSDLIGQLVKFKYQELTPDGVPRFPVFLGFRDARDVGEPQTTKAA